jgi:hypothetical protein
MIDDDECGEVCGMRTGKGKLKYSERTCPNATLSTTNPTLTGLEPEPPRWEVGD